MSQVHITPGATPSQRLGVIEFLKKKMQLMDNSHTNAVIEKLSLEKKLARITDQVVMYEGAVLYLKQIISEWTVYSNDTQRIWAAEDKARLERKIQKELKKPIKDKVVLKNKRQSKSHRKQKSVKGRGISLSLNKENKNENDVKHKG